MQCDTCGTQLPAGAAYCPTCGSVTPSNVSSSGVAPSDPTVFTSYGESSQNPYPSGEAPQSPYPHPDPYTNSSTAPPPPAVRRRRLSAMIIALLIVLALLIVAAGGAFYFFKVASSTRQPATHSQAAQATPTAQTPQSMYSQVTQGTPVLDDPLLKNDTNNWTEGTSSDGTTSCGFTGGAYHAKANPQNTYSLCMAQGTNFSDFAYQVQMTIAKGEFGGMVFRADSAQVKYYSFFIDRYGNYTLVTSVDNTGTRDYVLQKGTSSFIRTGLNQVNTLAVIARGNTIYLYINEQYITSANDSSYHAGQIGVFGGNMNQAPADVVFSRVQVWNV